MTTTQINAIIGTSNINTWLSLDDLWVIQLVNDGHVYCSHNESQFFFDDGNELMFVRYTHPYIANRKVNEEFVACEKGWLRLLQGGTTDSNTNIGRYHEVFSFDAITSIQ